MTYEQLKKLGWLPGETVMGETEEWMHEHHSAPIWILLKLEDRNI